MFLQFYLPHIRVVYMWLRWGLLLLLLWCDEWQLSQVTIDFVSLMNQSSASCRYTLWKVRILFCSPAGFLLHWAHLSPSRVIHYLILSVEACRTVHVVILKQLLSLQTNENIQYNDHISYSLGFTLTNIIDCPWCYVRGCVWSSEGFGNCSKDTIKARKVIYFMKSEREATTSVELCVPDSR